MRAPRGIFVIFDLVFELADLGLAAGACLFWADIAVVEPFRACFKNLKYHKSCMQKCFNAQQKLLFPDFEQVQIAESFAGYHIHCPLRNILIM